MKTLINLLLFVLCFFSMSSSLTAQEFIVISCTGDVHHVMDQDTIPHKVRAGDKIAANGKLFLDVKSSVKLICNERPESFSDVEEVDLAEVYSDISVQSISFTGRFWNFIVDGLKSTDSDKDLKEYHSEFLDVKGGVRGYSEKNSFIKIVEPFGGIITGNMLSVAWSSKKIESMFTVSILDVTDREVLYENKTKRKDHTISLKDINLTRNNQKYYLKVSDEDCNHSEMKFQYGDIDHIAVNKKLNSIIEYQEAEEKEKAWMRATVLEMEGYLVDADKLFQKLLKEYPEDNYIQKLYLLFKIRTNQIETP